MKINITVNELKKAFELWNEAVANNPDDFIDINYKDPNLADEQIKTLIDYLCKVSLMKEIKPIENGIAKRIKGNV